jgi:hypothetical protein
MSTDDWLILRAVGDVAGIICAIIALRCFLKHHGRIHV